MSLNALEHRVRDLVGHCFDSQHHGDERFAATRALQISAIPGANGLACGVTVTLTGTPTRGMVVLSDLGYSNGVGVDVLAGTALASREIALVRDFVAKAARCEIGKLASDFTWRSNSVAAAAI